MNVSLCYTYRFSKVEAKKKELLWQTLVNEMLKNFIPPHATVMDLGAGYCEFLHSVTATKKIAVDMNPETRRAAGKNIIVLSCDILSIPRTYDATCDVIMASNILEHLPDRETLLLVLARARKLLKPRGTLLIIQPSISLAGNRYWDFIDHHIALTEQTLREALSVTGFSVTTSQSRFLPFTTKLRLPMSPSLLRLYLRLPSFLRVCAGQFFLAAQPSVGTIPKQS